MDLHFKYYKLECSPVSVKWQPDTGVFYVSWGIKCKQDNLNMTKSDFGYFFDAEYYNFANIMEWPIVLISWIKFNLIKQLT